MNRVYEKISLRGADVTDIRWREEMEEAMELVYRIQVDHSGSLPKSEACELGPWVDTAVERAQRLSWLASTGDPPVLKVTYGGRKALDAALASREANVPQPHWFGGSIVAVTSETGPVLPAQSYKPYEELKSWALEQGILTQEDIDRVARSPRQEPQEPQEYAMLENLSFPGTRMFVGVFAFEDSHPFGGGVLDPAGHEGAYQVVVTLKRRGAPDVSFVYATDAYMMEGDSHLRMIEKRRDDGAVGVPLLTYITHEGETLQFQLLANSQSRLGQIRAVIRAKSTDDARRKAYRILNPFLCDLSYRYDVPIEVLQMNIAEIATYTLSGMKQDDFREKVFDPEQFLGSGLNYEKLPNYEFFMRLYREGANSSSIDYGFLCFFRIAEGVILLRRKRIAEREGKSWKEVPRPEVFLDHETAENDENDEENLFSSELLGKSLWEVYEKLKGDRVKVGHGFLDEEDPLRGHEDIIADRLEGEEQAGTRRAQARYLARRMLQTEFWASDKQE
jgi:Methylamine utilization protein MauJ